MHCPHASFSLPMSAWEISLKWVQLDYFFGLLFQMCVKLYRNCQYFRGHFPLISNVVLSLLIFLFGSYILFWPRWFRLVSIAANFKFRKVALVPGIEYAIMVISYAYATSLVEFTNNILFVLMGILQNTCSKTVLKRVGVRPLPCFKPEFPLKLCVNSLWIFYGIICCPCLVSSFVLVWVKFASHALCYCCR